MCVCVGLYRAGVMMQPKYTASAVQQQSAGYQYYTPVFSQYPSVAVPPPPPATWLQPAATPVVTPGITNHYVVPQQMQQLQPAVCSHVLFSAPDRFTFQCFNAVVAAIGRALGLYKVCSDNSHSLLLDGLA